MDLKPELERALAERARLDVVIAYLQDRLNHQAPTASRNTRKRKGKLTAAAAAEQALRAAGTPMRTPAILKQVQALGAQIKDTDGLYRTLLRHGQFKREGRGLWSLVESGEAESKE